MRRAALALLAATGTLWATASAAMDSETPTVTLRLSVPSVAYGDDVTARGRVSLEGRGRTVVLEQRRESAWRRVAVTRTDATGAFTAAFAPRLSGAVRARLAERGAASPAASLGVRPVVRVRTQPGRAFLGARLRLRIRPAAWSGTVTVRVARGGRLLATERKQVAGGSARVQVPTPGVGRFRVRLVLGASESYERVRALGSVVAAATPLAYGSTGPEVRALLDRLEELRYHVPAERDVFGPEALDAVLAFQKAEGLTRDGAVGEDVWAALGHARAPKPRFRRPALHIEVDKTRQILMVVREGKVESVVSVSTGATGNTPEGAFRILWKAPATTTWLGPAILYRTMTFLGNEFAIHGFPEVPAYAASHGCVRVPMWLADWLYQRSPVGERIFIYR